MKPTAKQLFQEALDQPTERRRSWVRTQCGDDADLLSQVESLLDAHNQASMLDRGPVLIAETALAPSNPAPKAAREQVGDLIDGKFELLNVLGEGGFGIVYRARQLTPVVRDVALKILRTGLDSQQIVARFDAERQTLALMDHPGIARVYDAGETEQGRPYITMEFIDGLPITTFCERNGLGIEERLRLIEQVCMAIQHAHTKGVIHRDLKPSNILVTLLDGQPFPTVIDFGIAKAVDPTALASLTGNTFEQPLTHEFQVIGTPQYMSPEQATRGESRQIDTRSDVYSIGTILYELVAGVPPFDPAELRRAGFEGILRVIREQTPARPSTRLLSGEQSASTMVTRTFGESPERVSRRIAGDVDWIVMRSLEKEPARRYQTAAEFAADIRRHLAHEPVLAGPPSKWYAAKKFIRRHRISVASAAVVAIALIATATISLAAANRASEAEAVAIENELKAKKELTKALAVADFMRDLLAGVAPSVARGRDTTLLREVLDTAANTAPRSIESEGLIDLTVRHLIATVMSELGEYQRAYDVLRPAYDATASLTAPQDRIDRLLAGPLIGDLLGQLGETEQAHQFLLGILAEHESLGLGHAAGVIDTLNTLAENAMLRGENQEAKALAERALSIAKENPNVDPHEVHAANDRLANALVNLGNIEEAISIWEANLEEVRARKGDSALETMSIRASLGWAYQSVARFDDAEKNLRETLAAMRGIYEPQNPRLIATLNIYGALLEDRGRFEEAVAILEEARAAAVNLQDEDTRLAIDGRLARSLAGLEQYDRAIAMNHDVMARLKAMQPPDESQIFVVLWHMVQVHTQAGRPREALEIYSANAPKEGWSDQILAFHHAVMKLSIAQAHLDLGELDAAREHAERAKEFLRMDGRTRGRYVRQLAGIEAAIATATTRPTTMPATQRVAP